MVEMKYNHANKMTVMKQEKQRGGPGGQEMGMVFQGVTQGTLAE